MDGQGKLAFERSKTLRLRMARHSGELEVFAFVASLHRTTLICYLSQASPLVCKWILTLGEV